MALPKSATKFVWHFIKLQPFAFFIIFSTALVWSLNEMFFPYFIKLIVNALSIYKGPLDQIYYTIRWPLIAFILFWVAMELSMRTQWITIIYAFPKLRANIRLSIYNYVKEHSIEYFSNNFAGSIAKKIVELPTSCQTIIEIVCFNFVSILAAFFIAVTLLWISKPLFAAILLIWFILHMTVTWIFLRIGNEYSELHAEASSTLSGKIVDSLTNIFTVHTFARSNFESDYMKKFQMDEIKKSQQAAWIIEKMRIIQGLLGLGLIFVMVFTLLHGWTKGWVSLGDFPMVGMLTFWMLGMIWYLSYQLSTYVREIGIVNEALTLITPSHDIVDIPNAPMLKINKGQIEFKDVTFYYQKRNIVFNHLNVTIPAGQKVGLVGVSGSGKTTFVNLILRGYDLKDGGIYIDQQNIAKVSQQSLRAQIAMIPQDPTLFHRTLKENIHYGRIEASEDEIINAAKLAHCQEFIENIPEGYNALVGERGLKLSGGQRQRIAIARAILKNAPILILDEATSALDSATEHLIQESLHHLMQNRTTLVVAHRLSTLSDMDRILVFSKGQIVEDGTHQALIEKNGHFAKLWNMQIDGFLPDSGIDNTEE